ncbi:unnamed protein product [Caenorhabditis auriculariae]|uniref:Tyrosine-protein kinase n=1 Tax=Caenorhabditis auriculariae TaxID=2777116 RepID=A0A8S1HBB0_9PELO|nr:unnamed protein product [Caenorhabditis auriculariae]
MPLRVDSQLEAENYFHGFLDTDDVNEILQKSGDFLVRYTVPISHGADYNYVVSVVAKPTTKEKVVKDFAIMEKDKGFMFEDGIPMSSVFELISRYKNSKKPIADGIALISPKRRKKWELRMSSLELEATRLSEGNFGHVLKGFLKSPTGEKIPVAVKQPKTNLPPDGNLANDLVNQMLCEARALRQTASHLNVISLQGIVTELNPPLLVMDLVEGSDLAKALRSQIVSDQHRLPIIIGVASGLSHIHLNGIVHRDISAQNVLLSHDFTKIKICDFGLARIGPSYTAKSTRPIPYKWMAPETLMKRVFSFKTDVWSFGVLVWEVYNDGADPYTFLKPQETRVFLLEKREKLGFNHAVIECPQGLVDFITKSIFEFSPEKRCNIITVCEKLKEILSEQDPTVQQRCIPILMEMNRSRQTAVASSRTRKSQSLDDNRRKTSRGTKPKSPHVRSARSKEKKNSKPRSPDS